MGWFEKVFGGTETKQHTSALPYIDKIMDYTDSLKIGIAGKTAKKGLKALSSGNYDSDPVLSGYFNPIRDFYATANRDSEREAQMGVGAMFEGAQPVLAQRVRALNEARNREAAGQAMTSMVPDLYSSFSNTFQNAKNSLVNAKQGGYNSALQGYLNTFYQKQQGGIIPALSQAAGAVGSMATGFGGAPKPAPSPGR